MSFTDDSSFTRATTILGETQIEGKLLQEKPMSSGVTPYDFSKIDDGTEDVTIADSFWSGLTSTGVISGALQATQDTADPITDPTFNVEDWAAANPEKAKVLEPLLQNDQIFSKIVDVRNATQMDEFVAKVEDSQRKQKEMFANPVSGIAGMVSGIGLDLLAYAAVGGVAGVSFRGAAAIPEITAAIRAMGAARAGAAGATEGFAERTIHSFSDPTITTDDIIIATAIGGTLTAGLGGLFPRVVGGLGVADDLAKNVPLRYSDDVINEARAMRGLMPDGNIGAARVVGTDEIQVPGRFAAGLGVARVVDRLANMLGVNAERWFRNPKRALVDMGITGKKEFENSRLEGFRIFYDRMSRVARIGIANQAEIDGTGVRATAAEDMRLLYSESLTKAETDSQQVYTDMLMSLQGKGKLKAHIINSATAELRSSGKTKYLTQNDLEFVADNYAYARAMLKEGEQVDPNKIIPLDIKQKIKSDQLDDFMQFVKKQAAIDDEYYQNLGQLEVRHGLIPSEELIPGYRPQRWNVDAINTDPAGFDNFLRRVFKGNPDQDWLKSAYKPVDDAGNEIPWDGTIEGLRKIDDDLANDAIETWDIGLREEAIEKRLKIVDKRDAELKKFQVKTREELEDKFLKATERDRKLIEKLQEDINKSGLLKEEREAIALRIGKAERRLIDEETKLVAVRALDDSVKEIDDFIGKVGTKAQKKVAKKLVTAARKADQSVISAQARKLFGEQIKAIRDNLENAQGLGTAFVPDGFSVNSGRFMRRSIKLGDERFSPEARKFLTTQSGMARRAYDHSVAPILALRDITGDLGATTISDYRAKLIDWVMEGFETDAKRLSSTGKSQQKYAKDRKRAREFAEMYFEEFTGRRVNGHPVGAAANQWMGLGMSLTSTSLLGGMAVAQLSDLAVLALAGGKWGTGFRFLFGSKGKGIAKHLRELDDTFSAVLLQGSNTMDASRFRALVDLDEEIYTAGGRLSRVRRIADEMGTVQGWANFMHVWNRMVRGSFGASFAKQMASDFQNFSGLSKDLKRFYAKHGIGDADANDIAAMLRDHGFDAINGLVRLPDTAKWSELRPDLLIKYRVAMRSAADEALLDPGIGDRPFLKNFAAGRMVLQFASFMFKAGERFIPVLTQELMLNPMQSQVLFSIFMVATMSPVVGYLQAARYGKGEEWIDKWSTPEGARDNLWDAVLRSPLMAGMSSSVTEGMLSAMAQSTNDAAEAMAGVRPFTESESRFRQGQGAWGALGPMPSLFLKSIPGIAEKFATGDIDKAADALSKRLPITNIFYLQLIKQLMEK